MKKTHIGIMLIVLFACACRTAPDKAVIKEGEINREWIEEGVTAKYVFARGMGAADQKLENKTQRMATSRNAAVVNAQYNMLSLVKGVKLEGGITVAKAIETDSVLATKINDVIKGAQIVRSGWSNDDGCVVSLKLSKDALKTAGLQIAQ
ncbi:MAG: hypothetical protein NTX59_04695 [Elusimicrobia bacterium]|nr:hypothetical protein [Elusimicrobiota bacterium]